MTTYVLSLINNQRVTFNIASDRLESIDHNASNLTVTQSGTDVVIAGTDGTATLANINMSTLTATNFLSLFGSSVVIGDLTSDTLDGGDNSIDFITNGAISASLNKDNLVYGLAGNDTVNIGAGTGNNKIFGGAGADTITAGSGANTIFGGNGIVDSTDGADNITVGSGANVIYANGGADTITFSTATAPGLTSSVWGGAGGDTVTSSSASGNMYVNGGADADSISILLSGGTHTVYGGLGTDTLNFTGSAGSMTIFGGIDTVDTADTGDTITSGSGASVIYANGGTDTVTLNTIAGNSSTVYLGAANDSLTSGAVGGSYLIYGGAGGDVVNLTGHTGDATVYGGSSSVDASDSADTITAGGSGNLLIYANGGNDTLNYSAAAGKSVEVFGGAGNDIHNITFSSTSGVATLKDFGTGSDILNTTLTGGTATDLVLTRTSTSTTVRNASSETFAFENFTGNFTSTNFVLSGGSRLLTNFGGNAATLTGSDSNDQVWTGDNGDNVIAGDGVDVLRGGSGNDTFNFAANRLTAQDYVSAAAGTDAIGISDASSNVSDAVFANKSGVETVKLANANFSAVTISLGSVAGAAGINKVDASLLTGSNGSVIDAFSLTHAFTFVGGGGADDVQGSVYNDTLSGAGGVDSLFGGVGADSISGGAGNDVFVYESNAPFIATEGGDIITDFDAGTSTTAVDRFEFKAAAISYNLGDNTTVVSGAVVSSVTAAGAAGTELVILNTVGVATANITASLDTLNSLVTAGKGVIDVLYDTTKGHASVYYDSNGSTAGGHVLLAELTGVTNLADMSKFDFGDFSFV